MFVFNTDVHYKFIEMRRAFDAQTKKKMLAFFYETAPDDRLLFSYDQLLISSKQLQAVTSSCITTLFNEPDVNTIMREIPEKTSACVMLHADILKSMPHDSSPNIVRSMRFKLAQEPVCTIQQMQQLSTRVLATIVQDADFWVDSAPLKKIVYEGLYQKDGKNSDTWTADVDKCTQKWYNTHAVLKCGELAYMMQQTKCEMDDNFEHRQHCTNVTKHLPYKVWMLTLTKKGVTENTLLKVKVMPCSNLRASLVACSMHMSGFTKERQTGRFDKHCHFRLHPNHGIHPADFATMAIPHMRTHAQKIAQLYFKCMLANTILLQDDHSGEHVDAANIDLHNYDETSLQVKTDQLQGQLNSQQLALASSTWQKSMQDGHVKIQCMHGSQRMFNQDESHTDVMLHTTHEIEASCSLNGVRLTFTAPLSISIFGTCFVSV
jgi:hypothetical protein